MPWFMGYVELPVSPNDFAVQSQAGRAVGSEMDEEMFAIRDGRGAGVAVFVVDPLRGPAAFP